ncbi:MAG: hypothetical protein HQ539_00555 [Parcubacteria group bacterium]|nr:hypothetical protein [Parcubacteria group bacterium]
MGLFAKENINNKELLEAIMRMNEQIKSVDGRLTFDIKIDNEGWIARCREFDGITTAGTNNNPLQEEIMQSLIDAVKTAFHIPISKLKIQNNELQKFPEFPKIRYKKEFQMQEFQMN